MARVLEKDFGHGKRLCIYCPACKRAHVTDLVRWTWNGDVNRPTFHPSILHKFERTGAAPEVCHSFVKDGMIQFLGDCTHECAGKTLSLEEWTNENAVNVGGL